MARKKRCENCAASQAVAKGLCKTCHEYQRRNNGRMRPHRLIVRQWHRNLSRAASSCSD